MASESFRKLLAEAPNEALSGFKLTPEERQLILSIGVKTFEELGKMLNQKLGRSAAALCW